MKAYLPLILSLAILSLVSCSKQSRAERLIENYMHQTAYDFDSYEPIETEVSECNHSIWCNLRAISAAKKVVDIYNQNHTSFSALDKGDTYDVWMLIDEHLDDFGDYLSLEMDTYDGYSILHKFRIKNRLGIYDIHRIRYITDKRFKKVVATYAVPEDYIDTMSEAYVLGKVHDVHRAKRQKN